MAVIRTKEEISSLLLKRLDCDFGVTLETAGDENIYRAASAVVGEILRENHLTFQKRVKEEKAKRVYYLCMEFLMGRSLKNNLCNLKLYELFSQVLKEAGINPGRILDFEPDAGIGNGGLGRLGACFLDALATGGYPSMGYSICYEFGIFKQKIVDGWQKELPDDWLGAGDVWLNERPADEVEVRFGGHIEELWEGGYNNIKYVDYTSVRAVPYDMYVSGYGGEGVSVLRLFKAENPGIDMQLFQSGDYLRAMESSSMSEIISKVLYPNDNHREGKILRLRQQYFLTAAAVADIVKRHLSNYGTLETLADKTAIHLNDTHPALAVAELLRILLDECGLTWEKAWDIARGTFAYTNHTVMQEALEVWDEALLKEQLPRHHYILLEVDRRLRGYLAGRGATHDEISRMAVMEGGQVRMANLSVAASHSVNGVSGLHSQIIKDSVFKDFYRYYPGRFTNVTNGIAYRRWLQQSNPALYQLLCELSGADVSKDASLIEKAMKRADDPEVLHRIRSIKAHNKERLAKYIFDKTGNAVDPASLFDVQVKRLHEYKRQHLNALHILSLYHQIKANPGIDIPPRTFLFGAKAAPGYDMAKRIISLICSISDLVRGDPSVKDRLNVVFLEDYSVTMSEILMPAADISEQISLAGTEASGTGNMKLMLNGAITLGTMDGANVEIYDQVGADNIVIFGMTTPEVDALRASGYRPASYLDHSPALKEAVELLGKGVAGRAFPEIAHNLLHSDHYMVLADFEAYRQAQCRVGELYKDRDRFARMSFVNTAKAGFFAADRAVGEYAKNIWGIGRL